jgi:hypothetical protein
MNKHCVDWYKVRQWFKPHYVWTRIWWRFVGKIEVTVKWPTGDIVVDHNDPRWYDLGGAVWISFFSADPNDHYRPWMEQNVGRQNWDWNWELINNNVAENRLTIRMREKHAVYATHIALMWN